MLCPSLHYCCASLVGCPGDLVQNVKFYKGIMYAVRKMQEMGIKPHVLDIGTGTGLLSLMAVTCGVQEVTACEVRRCLRGRRGQSCDQHICDYHSVTPM